MCPLDVERRFQRPARVRLGQARLNVLDERGRVGDAVLAVERLQVGADVGVVVGGHDRDRLAGSIARNRAVLERDLVDPVSLPHLVGTQPRRAGAIDQRRRGQIGVGHKLAHAGTRDRREAALSPRPRD